MKASPHTHAESPLTGSTLANLVGRAKELGRTHFAYTDHGHLSSALKAYALCAPDKKSKLEHMKRKVQMIAGLEFYFKDSNCSIIGPSASNRCKYFTATVYCQDQTAYQELCRIVSRNDFPTIQVYEETQQLWGWKELEQISKFNVTLVLAGPHCMVGKPMLAGDAALGEKVLIKLKSIFGDKLYAALVVEPWLKKWNSVVEIKYEDGTKDALLSNDTVSTDRARRIKAFDLTESTRHGVIKSKSSGGMNSEVNKKVKSVKLHKGFLPLPGGDVTLKCNRFLNIMAARHGIKLLATDYAYYANKEDKIVQTMRLEGNNKLQPNLHMKTDSEIHDYFSIYMGMLPEYVKKIMDNTDEWATSFDNFTLKYDWRLATVDGDPIRLAMDIIKKNGRMRWDDPIWVERLKEEIAVIAKNPKKDLTAYFLPIRDVLNFYRENGQLTGPGRGSAGGSLFCYLLGITQVNPFKYDLPFNRFFSLDRIMMGKLPDIDVDLEDRELLVGPDGQSGYLYGRWGNKAAQISTRTTIRLKSAIADTNRYFKGKVEPEITVFTKGLPAPPQGVTDGQLLFGYENEEEEHIPGLIETSEDLKKYAAARPDEWDIVQKAMGLTRAFSQHASAFVLSDVAISETVPTKQGHITQYEAKACEEAGLIKYDFLVVKQLKDIRVCMDFINKHQGEARAQATDKDTVGYWHPESDSGDCVNCCDVKKEVKESGGQVDLILRSEARPEMICDACKKPFKEAKIGHETGYFTHQGTKTYVWDLPDVMGVYQSVWQGATESCFQIQSRSMTPFVTDILPTDIMEIASILAIDRPGPLDFIDPKTGRTMAAEYCLRRKGQSQPDIKELFDILPKTYGIFIYQEDLTKIAKELAGFPGNEAELLRENMAKKKKVELMKMKPKFVEGASKKVSPEIAEEIWNQMETFGRYGFSIIHAVEYALITYACMFFKHFYPLEWWAAILTNAKEQEITGKFWPYVKDKVLPPDINLSSDYMVVDYANETIRAKFGIIRGMGDKTLDPIVEGRPYKNIQDYVDKEVAGSSLSHKLIHVGVLDSLFPPKIPMIEKLRLYENAAEVKKFRDKQEKSAKEGKKMRATQPKEGVVPEDYINLHPMKDAAMKKAVLPTMPINLFELGKKYSKVIAEFADRPSVISARGYKTLLLDGERLKRLDEMDPDTLQEDIYVAATCFVIKCEEFSYSKGTKRALKLILDADGYTSEKVLWPEYESGNLVYPIELKKGAIVTVFFKKRQGKKDMSIMSVTVET